MCFSVQFSQIVSKSVCSVNNRGDVFGTTYVIGIHAVCFHGTLIKGLGSRRVLYNFLGMVCSITLYGGGGCQKIDIFCYIIVDGPISNIGL